MLGVGANEGHYGVQMRERGFTGRIVSFEQIPAVYRALASRAASDPRWEAHQLGVGEADGELSISLSADSVFSSFKAPSDYTSGKFSGAREEQREAVPVVRLDSFLGDRLDLLDDCFLKIETQGFERESWSVPASC